MLDAHPVQIGLWAVAIALLMATQFLSQPFVWRNYPLSSILQAWLDLARDRLIVAGIIAVALMLAGRLTVRSLRLRLVILGCAIVVGAVAGELLLQVLAVDNDRQDLISLLSRIVRWSLIGSAVAALIYLWRAASELATASDMARAETAGLRKLAASAQIESLQRQIEPHFLFNTLATIRNLHRTNPERGDQLLERLLAYMAASIEAPPDGLSTLAYEVALARAYLDVCATRMNGRLEIVIDVPPDLEACLLPTLALPTLAENAIKHGIFPQDGGTVWIEARREGGLLAVTLADDGVGFSGDSGGTGIGLANMAERLRLLHGPAASLRLGLNDPCGVRATITLPITLPIVAAP